MSFYIYLPWHIFIAFSLEPFNQKDKIFIYHCIQLNIIRFKPQGWINKKMTLKVLTSVDVFFTFSTDCESYFVTRSTPSCSFILNNNKWKQNFGKHSFVPLKSKAKYLFLLWIPRKPLVYERYHKLSIKHFVINHLAY